jgi:tetratricopeptide (TPR) repeat protein
MSNKRMKYLALLVLFLSLLVPVSSLTAEDVQQNQGETGKSYSGLYQDFDDLMDYRTSYGLRNLEPHSLVLLNRGLDAYKEDRVDEAVEFFKKALELSPDMPYPYLYLAKANFSLSRKGIYSASGYLLGAWEAFWTNFWFSFQTYGVILISFFFMFYVAFLVLSASLIASRLKLFFHDLREHKEMIIFLVPSLVLLFIGPLFGVMGLMLPFWIYLNPREKTVYYFCMAVIAVILLMLPVFISFLSAPQDRTFRSVVKINRGMYTDEFMDLSKNKNSYESLFSYALNQKRKGNYREAIKSYKVLLRQGNDARAFNNLANCYVGLGKYDIAFAYYKKALEVEKTASTYFNISQLYRETMNFEKGEKNYQLAVGIDPGVVDTYEAIRGKSSHRFVIDETLSNKTLWTLAFKSQTGYQSANFFNKLISFVNREISIILVLIVIAGFVIYGKKASDGAYRCKRCGKIYCAECEKRISQENVCIVCYKTLIKVSELSSKNRIERILEIQHFRERKNWHLKFLTILFPGSGHLYHGWTVYGLVILLFFSFFLCSFALWKFFPAPVSLRELSAFFKWSSVAGLVLTYGLAIENVFRRIPRRWL